MRQLGAGNSGGRCRRAVRCTKDAHGCIEVEVILHSGLLLADLREAGRWQPRRGRGRKEAVQGWQGGCCLAVQCGYWAGYPWPIAYSAPCSWHRPGRSAAPCRARQLRGRLLQVRRHWKHWGRHAAQSGVRRWEGARRALLRSVRPSWTHRVRCKSNSASRTVLLWREGSAWHCQLHWRQPAARVAFFRSVCSHAFHQSFTCAHFYGALILHCDEREADMQPFKQQ